jgi:hypothetical protein
MVKARKASADQFAANVLPMIRAMQAMGFTSSRVPFTEPKESNWRKVAKRPKRCL